MHNSGDLHRAIDEYTKAIKNEVEYSSPLYLFRGLAYEALGDKDAARDDYELSTKGDLKQGLTAFKFYFSMSEFPQQVISSYFPHTTIQPQGREFRAAAYYRIGMLMYNEMNEYMEKNSRFKAFLKSLFSGYTKKTLNNMIYTFSEAITLKPDFFEAYRMRGVVRSMQSDYARIYLNRSVLKKAVSDFQYILDNSEASITRRQAQKHLAFIKPFAEL